MYITGNTSFMNKVYTLDYNIHQEWMDNDFLLDGIR